MHASQAINSPSAPPNQTFSSHLKNHRAAEEDVGYQTSRRVREDM